MIDVAILVGGRGSRLGKITKKIPKPLLKIDKKKFLDYLLVKLSKHNFKNIYLLCSYKKKIFFKEYNNKKIKNSKILCLDEGKYKGTGGALFKLKNKIKKNFLLINGDTYFDINYNDLLNTNIKNFYGCIALTKISKHRYNKKIIDLKISRNRILKYSDKKTDLMNGGVYFLNKKIFKYIKNKNLSLENDIITNIIYKKKIKGKYFRNNFIDIGTYNNFTFIKRKSDILKNRAIFLDRDGVINKENGYILNYSEFKFLPGVKKAIKYLNKNNYLVILITNQGGIGKSLLNENKLINIHNKMEKELWNYKNAYLDDIYYAPYYKYSKKKKYRLNKNDRKPGNGMFLKAIDKWCIDTKKSIFIGDKNTDKIAAKKTKIQFYYKKNISLYKQIKQVINHEK